MKTSQRAPSAEADATWKRRSTRAGPPPRRASLVLLSAAPARGRGPTRTAARSAGEERTACTRARRRGGRRRSTSRAPGASDRSRRSRDEDAQASTRRRPCSSQRAVTSRRAIAECSQPSAGPAISWHAVPEPSADNPLHGSGLCGGVQFELTAPFARASHGHCSRCRKHSGAFGETQGRVPREGFRLLQGEELIRVYRPEGGRVKAFCSVCGLSLFGTNGPRATRSGSGSARSTATRGSGRSSTPSSPRGAGAAPRRWTAALRRGSGLATRRFGATARRRCTLLAR